MELILTNASQALVNRRDDRCVLLLRVALFNHLLLKSTQQATALLALTGWRCTIRCSQRHQFKTWFQ